jgi:hypothetical protein
MFTLVQPHTACASTAVYVYNQCLVELHKRCSQPNQGRQSTGGADELDDFFWPVDDRMGRKDKRTASPLTPSSNFNCTEGTCVCSCRYVFMST